MCVFIHPPTYTHPHPHPHTCGATAAEVLTGADPLDFDAGATFFAARGDGAAAGGAIGSVATEGGAWAADTEASGG